MNRYLYISATLLLSTCALTANAQTQPNDTTMNRVMVVETEYTPEIMDAQKINILPEIVPTVVTKKEVEYAIIASPATEVPIETLQPLIVNEKAPRPKTGFVRLGAGNYGNVDVMANYLFLITPQDKLDLFFQLDVMKGKLDQDNTTERWKSHYYRTRAAVNFTHQFEKVDFNIAANFWVSNFNYLPTNCTNLQRFTSGDLHVAVKSTDSKLPLQFIAETNAMLYQRKMNLFNNGAMTETRVKTKGDVWGVITEEQNVGVALEMNNLLYQGEGLRDYTTVDLNPYYTLMNDSWNLRLGAHVDFSLGRGKALRAAPDVNIELIFAESYVAYVKATGGRILNDFRHLEVENPYASINHQLSSTYEQLNASLGIKGSPLIGMWFHVFGGYQELKDDNYSWYTNSTPINPEDSQLYQVITYNTTNTKNAFGGATVSYDYREMINVSATAIYRHWKADFDWALLYKPMFELNLNADYSPIRNLLINANFQYIERPKIDKLQVGQVSSLNVGANYQFYKGISVFGKINNLLGKKYQWYFTYPTEKFNFLVGLSCKF